MKHKKSIFCCKPLLQKKIATQFLLFILIFSINSIAGGQSFAQKAEADIEPQKTKIFLQFGHTSTTPEKTFVNVTGNSPGLVVSPPLGINIEKNDTISDESVLHFGSGDIDELVIETSCPRPTEEKRTVGLEHTNMWDFFFANGSEGQVKRLLEDPWNKPDAPIVNVKLNEDGTRGFSLGVEQLLNHGAMWLPDYDIYVTTAENPINYENHIASLKGQKTLERVHEEADATLEDFRKIWTDFGNPLVSDPSWNDWQTEWMGTKGHLTVTAAAHGSIYKFAVDRLGNVRPDFASPYKFRFDFTWNDGHWEKQKIENGLPIIVTQFCNENQKCGIEQFAAPLHEFDAGEYGNIPSVFLSKVNFSGEEGPVSFKINFSNEENETQLQFEKSGDENWIVSDKNSGKVLLMLYKNSGQILIDNIKIDESDKKIKLSITTSIKSGQSNELIIKLPSPAVSQANLKNLASINYAESRKAVENYWNGWLAKGAKFEVPDENINNLFRANLWHALVLPRHTVGKDNELHMDIPYANTAYGQQNADWPINQAVYVDYLIYGLRGYNAVAENELAAMFKTQQQGNGMISGYANWGVYSPGHLYAIAQIYLLSRNNELFERLLPQALKTLNWCLSEIDIANSENESGLILAPLNDNSPTEHEWAFTQAYFVGGLELFGKALLIYGHDRATEVLKIAKKMKKDVVTAFSENSVKTPVVRLADGTWTNYISTDAMTSRRMIDQWYPTDVDTGPLHLARLGVFEPKSWLTTSMLNDHEDNLFFKNQGAANEPVYLPQANTYLLRDEPKAAIRSFFSMMAAAFSHNQLTSLEHRWAHPIYYAPPSTDGAWFEIYRKMLLHEINFDTLVIGQAVPRYWLEHGKEIKVSDAPSYFGPVSFKINGVNKENEITAEISLSDRIRPKELMVRFRHPESLPIRSVSVNGKPWHYFNSEKETIRISAPDQNNYSIVADY